MLGALRVSGVNRPKLNSQRNRFDQLNIFRG